jgi:bifunctional non-homologous end joining protein LigD
MKFEPFIASQLFSQPLGPFRFDVPVQLSLVPESQSGMNFALRLHDATHLHFDFRLQVLRTLFSLVLFEAPSLDPARTIRAKLMGDHDPRYLDSERVIPEGRPGAGPTMPVDLGKAVPIVKTYSTYEQDLLDQIARGDVRFMMNGQHLRGAWQLFSRDRRSWNLRKLEDEHASTSRILRLDRSVKTGNTLDDLRRLFPKA